MLAPRVLFRASLPARRSLASGVLLRSFSSSAAVGGDDARPFRILGVQQVAIGCPSREPLDALWKGIFGLEPSATKTIASENVQEDILQLGGVEIDLMTPIDADKSPRVHVPPLNHVGLWVDRLEDAVDWMAERGVRFTPGGIRKGAAGHNVVFIHPKGNEEAPISGEGVLIELVQAPEAVIQTLGPPTEDP